jgi:hypothetical protein
MPSMTDPKLIEAMSETLYPLIGAARRRPAHHMRSDNRIDGGRIVTVRGYLFGRAA